MPDIRSQRFQEIDEDFELFVYLIHMRIDIIMDKLINIWYYAAITNQARIKILYYRIFLNITYLPNTTKQRDTCVYRYV